MPGKINPKQERFNILFNAQQEGKPLKPEHLQELERMKAEGYTVTSGGAGGGGTTEGERKSSAFLTRALGANRDYERIKPGPRNLVAQKFNDWAPNLANTTINDSDRQVTDSAQAEFVAATLRYDSGAAIPPAELEAQKRIYFPQPGDGIEARNQKARARARALQGLIESSGRALDPKIRDQYPEFFKDKAGAGVTPPATGTPPTGTPPNSPTGAPPDETGKYAGADIQMHMDSPENAQGYRFTPTQETALREYLTGGNATPEGYGRMMTAFAAAQGVNVDDAYTQSATAQGQKLIEAAKAGKLGDGMTYTQSDKDYRDRLLAEHDAKGEPEYKDYSSLMASGQLAGGSDELKGIIGGVGSALSGNGFEAGYTKSRDTVRAIRDRAYEKHPYISGATEMLGALGTPGGVAKDVMRGGTLAERIAAGGKAGFRQGIAAGYGYGEGAGDSIKDAAIGGATGALIGGALPIAGKSISAAYNFATKRPAITAARDAAERLNINSTPAATGGAMSRGLQMAYGNLPGSSAAVESAAARETGDLANAARTVANDLGPVSNPKGAGKALSRGAGAWRRVTKAEAKRLYGERDKLMGGPDVPIAMAESRAAIDSFAQRFPNSPVLATLRESPAVRRLEKAMPDKGVLTLKESTELLSEARAALRNARRKGEATPAMEKRIADVEQAIENDVMNAARQVDQAAGRTTGGAADAQMTADKYYRNRAILKSGALKLPLSSRMDDVLASSESVYRDLSGDMAEKGGNFAKLQATWKALPTGAKRNFAATKFDEMGKATNGQQNADKTAWSFNTFLTNYSSLNADARKLVFGAQEDKIRDIATYAERLRQVDKSRNFSNTAKNTIAGAFMTVLGGALWKGDVQTAAATVAAVPAAWGSAKLFLSTPAMRAWTARALKATQQAANTGNAAPLKSLTGQLAGVAAREPAISGDVISLQNYLAAKFSESPSRAAATPGQDRNDRRPPPENNGQ